MRNYFLFLYDANTMFSMIIPSIAFRVLLFLSQAWDVFAFSFCKNLPLAVHYYYQIKSNDYPCEN
ncbi:MAG: hypothetical protein NVSMB27_25780 [Ktedonobacteraceae bacterium]